MNEASSKTFAHGGAAAKTKANAKTEAKANAETNAKTEAKTEANAKTNAKAKRDARFLRGTAALALLIAAPFAAIERAEAACTPATSAAAPASNTVTCTGATLNQNNPTGYGTGTETGITVNVQPGASVTGDSISIWLHDGTINNGTGGTIQALNASGIAIVGASRLR